MPLAEIAQSHSDIEAQLHRILTDESFQNAPQLSTLLSYLVSEALQGKAAELKAVTIARAVFRRDESFDAQNDTIVRVEAGRLRRRLADYYEGPGCNDPLIIAIPKGGYKPRFTDAADPHAQRLATPAEPPTTEAFDTRQSAWKVVALIAVCLALAALLMQRGALPEPDAFPPVAASQKGPFIAVLPFAHDETVIAQQVADRSAKAVISRLAKLRDLSVMAYRSTLQLANDTPSIASLHADHGVTHILDSQLDIHRDRILTRIDIVETNTGRAIWSEHVQGKLSDPAEFEGLLSNRIAAALSLTLDGDENERLYLYHSSNLEALDLFRYAIRAVYPPDSARIAAARDLFQRVTEIDPTFAGGYAGLSMTHSYSTLFAASRDPAGDLEQAMHYAQQAITVDPSFGMGVAMLGVAHTLSGETDRGLAYTRQAIGLEPGEPLSHQWLALSLIRSGRAAEGILAIKEALRLDPRDPQMPYLCILGMLYFSLDQNRAAISAFEEDALRGIRRGPYVYAMQTAAYVRIGNDRAAKAMIPQLNEDLVRQDFPVEAWLEGMLTNKAVAERALNDLYRIGMLTPEARLPDITASTN